MKFSALLLAVVAAVPAVLAANWGVLIAGSASYSNYRHQADVAHAYQIMKRGGIPDERIVVMVANDVVNHDYNPIRGQMFNFPDGDDVWTGLPIDYEGKDVNAETFLAVLSGNSTGLAPGSKVVNSGPNDNVFVFYSDHGSPGIIAMPYSEPLTVGALKDTLLGMSAAKKFNKLAFYLEACESGSMFEGWLTEGYDIYATTAANGVESSWGFYCPPDDHIGSKKIGTCLGDEYSISWMESVDNEGYDQTFQKNYETVKARTKGSHVQQFGDLAVADMTMAEFLAEDPAKLPAKIPRTFQQDLAAATAKRIDSRDIEMEFLYRAYTDSSKSFEERFARGTELLAELQSRLNADMRFRQLGNSILGTAAGKLANTAVVKPAVECGKCCEVAYKFLSTNEDCKFTDYSLKYGRTIQSVCMMNNEKNVDRTELVLSKLQTVCAKKFF